MASKTPTVYAVLACREGHPDYLLQGIHKSLVAAESRVARLKNYDWVVDAYIQPTFLEA